MRTNLWLKIAVIGAMATLAILYLPGNNPIETATSPFEGERAFTLLEEIVAIGPRVPGTPGSRSTQELINRELNRAKLKTVEYGFKASTPLGSRNMQNIVGIVEGTSSDVILVSAHYDTKHLPDINFVGANDSASGTALILELARVLGPAKEGYTVWLCFFDGEESFEEWTAADSLYGSRSLVKTLKENGKLPSIKAMINVDMIGDCDLGVFHDAGSPDWLTESILDAAAGLGYSDSFGVLSEAVQDDHVPFRREGVHAINLIDFRYGGGRYDHERNWHTSNDTLDKVCAESLQIVGSVVISALPAIEARLAEGRGN